MGTWPRAGTVSVANGSNIVTGNLTLWGGLAQPGNPIRINGGSYLYEIDHLDDTTPNTKLYLTEPFAEASVANAPYAILPFYGDRTPMAVATLKSLQQLITSQTDVVETSGTPDPGASPGNIAFDPAAKQYYYKVNGIWTGPVDLGGAPGWTPVFAATADGARRVLKIVDWIGGEGTKPAINKYVGATGVVDAVADGVDVRGSQGAQGQGIQPNAAGPFAGRAAHDGEAQNYVYLSTDGDGASLTTACLFVKNSASSGDWSAAVPIAGLAGPNAAVLNGGIPIFDGASGSKVKDSGKTFDADGSLGANSDNRVATQKAGKTYVDKRVDMNFTISASVTSNVLTVALKTNAGADPSLNDPVYLRFRNAAAATGDYVTRAITGPLSLVISNGSTLGIPNARAFRLWLVAFDDAGTIRLGLIQRVAGLGLLPTGIAALYDEMIASSTAEGGSGAADNSGVFYTGAAVNSKPLRILGYLEWAAGLVSAGAWASAPTKTQLMGMGIPRPGDCIKRSLFSTTTTFSTVSASYVDTGIKLALNLTDAPNLLSVFTRCTVNPNNNGAFLYVKLFMDLTVPLRGQTVCYAGGAAQAGSMALNDLVCPGDVAAHTYYLLAKTSAAAGVCKAPYCDNGEDGAMTVEEIFV
jgi:hypothetical protein